VFSLPDGTTLNDSFADFDFGRFYIMNMGSLFIFGTVTLLQFPIYYLAKCCTNNKIANCSRVVNYYKDS
jgi:hypothetical protein